MWKPLKEFIALFPTISRAFEPPLWQGDLIYGTSDYSNMTIGVRLKNKKGEVLIEIKTKYEYSIDVISSTTAITYFDLTSAKTIRDQLNKAIDLAEQCTRTVKSQD